jgi:hypothetical protein
MSGSSRSGEIGPEGGCTEATRSGWPQSAGGPWQPYGAEDATFELRIPDHEKLTRGPVAQRSFHAMASST